MTTLPILVFDLLIPQGVDWPGYNFPITGADGAPYNVTGCSARGEIRPHPDSDELYFAWSTTPAPGEGLITLTAGVLNLRTLAAETAPWRWLSAAYDVVLFNPDAPVGLRESRVVMGAVEISRAVTLG